MRGCCHERPKSKPLTKNNWDEEIIPTSLRGYQVDANGILWDIQYIYMINNMIGVLPETEDRSQFCQSNDGRCHRVMMHIAFILLNPILLLVVINICRCSSSTIGMSKYGVWMMDENQKNSVANWWIYQWPYSKIQPKWRRLPGSLLIPFLETHSSCLAATDGTVELHHISQPSTLGSRKQLKGHLPLAFEECF